MRDAAQKTATDLDSLRQEMQRRMEALPEQTAQATAAIRKALSDQLKEIEAITPALRGRANAEPGSRSYHPRRPPANSMHPCPNSILADGQGPDGDIGQVAAVSPSNWPALRLCASARPVSPAGGQWSVGDLLTAVAPEAMAAVPASALARRAGPARRSASASMR